MSATYCTRMNDNKWNSAGNFASNRSISWHQTLNLIALMAGGSCDLHLCPQSFCSRRKKRNEGLVAVDVCRPVLMSVASRSHLVVEGTMNHSFSVQLMHHGLSSDLHFQCISSGPQVVGINSLHCVPLKFWIYPWNKFSFAAACWCEVTPNTCMFLWLVCGMYTALPW